MTRTRTFRYLSYLTEYEATCALAEALFGWIP